MNCDKKICVGIGKLELLDKTVFDSGIETVLEYTDLTIVVPIITFCLEKQTLEFSNVYGQGVVSLLSGIQAIFYFAQFVWVIADSRELVENRLRVPGIVFLCP